MRATNESMVCGARFLVVVFFLVVLRAGARTLNSVKAVVRAVLNKSTSLFFGVMT